MDTYESARIYSAPQNLIMEEHKYSDFNKEETIRAAKHIIKEFQIDSTYIYRYLNF